MSERKSTKELLLDKYQLQKEELVPVVAELNISIALMQEMGRDDIAFKKVLTRDPEGKPLSTQEIKVSNALPRSEDDLKENQKRLKIIDKLIKDAEAMV